MRMFERFKDYALLIRLDKPIGFLLLLWPTLWGLCIAAQGRPQARYLLIFIAGVFVMRSAGCVINDMADKDIDPHVLRTKDRPLAAGRLSMAQAAGFLIFLCLLALLLVLNLNLKAIAYSFAGLLLAATYPFMKRVTHWPQLFLGVAFAWGIPMAFAAQTGATPVICWWLMLANIFWVVAYDTMYAMADKPDDLEIGVKSTAILFGDYDRLMVLLLQMLTLMLLIVVGLLLKLNLYYYLGLVLAGMFAAYQAGLYFTRRPQHCLRAFLNNTWFGASVFAGLVLAYLPA